MSTEKSTSKQQDDLIDRLARHDIHYFIGGHPERHVPDATLSPLLVDLARASSSRLRSALIALLLRHPEYVPTAEAVARDLPADDPAGGLLLLSVVVAAALQVEWSFTLDLYLPQQVRIQADHLAAELGLPSPRSDFGRPCLMAAARLLAKENTFPVNYRSDWENAAHRLRSQLVKEARARGA